MPQAIVPPELDAYVTDWRMSPGVEHEGFVFMTGFTGAGADGAMPDDPEAQMRAAFAKVGQVLTEAGLGFEHMVEMTSYHVGLRDHLDLFKRVRAEPFPAWTAIEVVGFVRKKQPSNCALSQGGRDVMDANGMLSEADHETGERPAVVCIAGFGDNGAMFAPLLRTQAGARLRIDPFDLPGFGAPALAETNLETLADAVDRRCRAIGARTVVAHSVASIIASLAARRHGSPIRTIVSLEGNLTPEDAYFSGTAADYDDPGSFRAAFMDRLDEMGTSDPIIRGYRERVAGADPLALWQLGRSARRFSDENDPGAVLSGAASVIYVLNPANCPAASLAWLDRHDVRRVVLDGASHWPTVDRATDVANVITDAVAEA